MKHKIVFFDMDGTLYQTENDVIQESALDAIQTLKDKGYIVCAATGRPLNQMKLILQRVQFDYYVLINGSYILDKDFQEIGSYPILQDNVNDLVNFSKKHETGLMFHFGDATYIYNNFYPMYDFCKYCNVLDSLFYDPSQSYHLRHKAFNAVVLTKDNIKYYDRDLNEIYKDIKIFDNDSEEISKNGYDHYMLKEINEEGEVVKRVLSLYTKDNKVGDIFNIKKYKSIDIVACGSAAFAGYIGKYYIEKYANIRTNVHYASEYRYQKNFFDKDTLVILISQSGETADTLAAMKLANEHDIDTLSIVNRRDSSIARESKYVIYTPAGIEIAVATTKAYLAQVIILILLAIKNSSMEEEGIRELKLLPNIITKYINDFNYKEIAKLVSDKKNVFYLGRGIDYYLALEGSLKLKEISYIHSEAFPAGELKHGSISLIDENFGVIAIVLDKSISDKTISNLKEVSSRGAEVIAITNIDKDDFSTHKILLDNHSEFLTPLTAIIPMQLLAYNTALIKGYDIDKPRNLAKSVTVE